MAAHKAAAPAPTPTNAELANKYIGGFFNGVGDVTKGAYDVVVKTPWDFYKNIVLGKKKAACSGDARDALKLLELLPDSSPRRDAVGWP